jgi:ribonuclease inhibitor
MVSESLDLRSGPRLSYTGRQQPARKQSLADDERKMRKPLIAVDMSEIASIDHLHQVLCEALDFPDWYGKNWDAFWDSITGLIEMPEQLQLIGWGVYAKRFPQDARIMKKCLDDMSNGLPTLAARVKYS